MKKCMSSILVIALVMMFSGVVTAVSLIGTFSFGKWIISAPHPSRLRRATFSHRRRPCRGRLRWIYPLGVNNFSDIV